KPASLPNQLNTLQSERKLAHVCTETREEFEAHEDFEEGREKIPSSQEQTNEQKQTKELEGCPHQVQRAGHGQVAGVAVAERHFCRTLSAWQYRLVAGRSGLAGVVLGL